MFKGKKSQYWLLVIGVLVVVVAVVVIVVVLNNDNDQGSKNKKPVVAIVNIAAVLNPTVEGFKEGMADAGYVDGKNITYLYDGVIARDAVQGVIENYVNQKVDVILALTTPVTTIAKDVTAESKTPVVFAPVTDPVAAGFVTDIRHPGGNMTGIISGQGENLRLDWLLKVAPGSKRILFPYNPNDNSPKNALAQLTETAQLLNVELVLVETPDADAVQAAIDNIPDDIDAIFLPPDSLVGSFYQQWAEKSIELKLPTSASTMSHVEGGILCSYSYSPSDAGYRAARLAHLILTGTAPGDLPVETAEPLYSLNIETAAAIGLDLPDSILRQANTIIRADQE